MALKDDISIRKENKVGRITLQRPKALNAITYEMCLAIEDTLIEWLDDPEINLVMIDAEGDKAFCAGGDIAELYSTGKAGKYDFGRKFWADEYRLNALIKNYPIPYVAFMDGITMGGGVGISAHGSDRIVTERTIIAMPECGIGLVPDVGASRILAKAPGYLGEFLAMSGYRMDPGDAVIAGFADVQINSDALPELKEEIIERGNLTPLGDFAGPPEMPALMDSLHLVKEYFSKGSALDCLHALEEDTGDWAREITKMIRKACPLSVACAFEIVRRVRSTRKIEEALALEYRFAWRCMSDGEFIEGVRAQIIDKDRKPKWKTKRLEDVTQPQIEAMLAPLGEWELNLGGKA